MAGNSACIMSFNMWQKLMATRTKTAVVVARGWLRTASLTRQVLLTSRHATRRGEDLLRKTGHEFTHAEDGLPPRPSQTFMRVGHGPKCFDRYPRPAGSRGIRGWQ